MSKIATPLRSTAYRVGESAVRDAKGNALFIAPAEVAQQLVTAVNAHKQLVAALKQIVECDDAECLEQSDIELGRAALAAAGAA